MAIITEPHSRREDCELCAERTFHGFCESCGAEHRIIYNGHHDHAAHDLAICTRCGSRLEEVAE